MSVWQTTAKKNGWHSPKDDDNAVWHLKTTLKEKEGKIADLERQLAGVIEELSKLRAFKKTVLYEMERTATCPCKSCGTYRNKGVKRTCEYRCLNIGRCVCGDASYDE